MVAEALMGLIYRRPSGENFFLQFIYTCLMMGEASLETSPKNNMIQDMINSNNMLITDALKRNAHDQNEQTISSCSLHNPSTPPPPPQNVPS